MEKGEAREEGEKEAEKKSEMEEREYFGQTDDAF